MSKNGDELEINVSKKTYKLIQTTKDLLIKEKNMDPLIKLSIMVVRLIDQYMWNRELKLQNQYLKYGFEHWKDIFNKSEELRTEKKTSLKRSRWKPDFVLKNNNIYLLPPVHKVKACYNYRDLRIVVKKNENIFYENCSPNINEIIGGYQIILEPIKIDCPLDKIRYLLMAKNEIIYDSTEKLYRDFIVFNQEGNEIFNNTDYQGTTIFCTRSFLPETQKYYSTNNYILSLLQVKLGEAILLEGSIFNFTSLVKPGLFGEKLKDCTLIQLKNEKRYPVYKIIEYLVFEDEKLNCDYKIYINGKCYSLNDFHYRVESNKGINRYIISLDILKTNIYSILIYRIRLEKNNKIAEFDFVIDSDLYVRTNRVDDKNFEITVNTGLLTQRIEKCVNVENFDFRNIQFEYLRQNYAYEIPLGLSFYRITKDKWHSFSDDLWIYDIKHDTILEIYGINADSISICSPEGIVLDELSINNKGIFGYVEIGFLTSYKEYDYISISMKKNGDAIKIIRCYNKCFIEDNGIEEIYDPITNELMITTDFKGKGKIFYEILDKNNNVFFKGKEKNSNECEHICGFNSFEEYTINILEKPRGLILGKGKILKSIKKIFYGRKDFVGRNFKIKEVYYYEYECENKKLVEKTLPFKMNYVKFTKQIDESTYIGSVYAKTSKGIFWLYKINPVEIEVNSDDISGTMDLYITNEGDGLLLDLKHKNLMNNLEDFNAPYIEIYVVDANGKEEL